MISSDTYMQLSFCYDYFTILFNDYDNDQIPASDYSFYYGAVCNDIIFFLYMGMHDIITGATCKVLSTDKFKHDILVLVRPSEPLFRNKIN